MCFSPKQKNLNYQVERNCRLVLPVSRLRPGDHDHPEREVGPVSRVDRLAGEDAVGGQREVGGVAGGVGVNRRVGGVQGAEFGLKL